MSKASKDGFTRMRRQFDPRFVHAGAGEEARYAPLGPAAPAAWEAGEERVASPAVLLEESAPAPLRATAADPAAVPVAAFS